ncbi:MAG: hypothetical protein MZV70_40650, partial [Desulfobacterales bacterium]|nr:hypothetical protein [Desulfobacterales bacterium]
TWGSNSSSFGALATIAGEMPWMRCASGHSFLRAGRSHLVDERLAPVVEDGQLDDIVAAARVAPAQSGRLGIEEDGSHGDGTLCPFARRSGSRDEGRNFLLLVRMRRSPGSDVAGPIQRLMGSELPRRCPWKPQRRPERSSATHAESAANSSVPSTTTAIRLEVRFCWYLRFRSVVTRTSKPARSAASSRSPFFSVDHPVQRPFRLRAAPVRAAGTGVPRSNRTRIQAVARRCAQRAPVRHAPAPT